MLNWGADWKDVSWDNDACPSWEADATTDRAVKVWIQPENPEEREPRTARRFTVCITTDDGEWVRDVCATESEDIARACAEDALRRLRAGQR